MAPFIWILVAYTIAVLVGRGRWRVFAALAGFSTVISFMGLDYIHTIKESPTRDFFTDGGGVVLGFSLVGLGGFVGALRTL
jgi:hypothetical protein